MLDKPPLRISPNWDTLDVEEPSGEQLAMSALERLMARVAERDATREAGRAEAQRRHNGRWEWD